MTSPFAALQRTARLLERRPRSVLIAAVGCLLIVPHIVDAVTVSSNEAHDAELNRAVAAAQQEVDHATATAAVLRQEIVTTGADTISADQYLHATLEVVESASVAVQAQLDYLRLHEDRVREAQDDLIGQLDAVAERTVALYREDLRPRERIAAAGSVAQALPWVAYIADTERRDQILANELLVVRQALAAASEALRRQEMAHSQVLDQHVRLLEITEAVRADEALMAAASPALAQQIRRRESHDALMVARLRHEAVRRAQAAGMADGSEPLPVLVWPVHGEVYNSFDAEAGHRGIDIAADWGQSVAATHAGMVVHADSDDHGGLGNTVVVAHRDLVTIYAHLGSIAVSDGQSVGAGTILGTLGCSGSCSGPHLHFEVLIDGQPVDPVAYLE